MLEQYGVAANGKTYPRYVCNLAAGARHQPVWSGLTGPRLDDVVSALAFDALKPATLEMSMRINEEIERDREKTEAFRHRSLRCE